MQAFGEVIATAFSPTGTTKKVVDTVARAAAEGLSLPLWEVPYTLLPDRKRILPFNEGQLVVFGVPVYAGRVPNLLRRELQTLQGNGATAVPVVVYGNRGYDDALLELWDLLQGAGFSPVSGAAFIGEHSFSRVLAAGRPDGQDLLLAGRFGRAVAQKLREGGKRTTQVKGRFPYRPYYMPRDAGGQPVDFRRIKPKTGPGCTHCGLCQKVCPMGSIQDAQTVGICIKCGACIKRCPVGARYIDDPDYLRHKVELEQACTCRKEPELFL